MNKLATLIIAFSVLICPSINAAPESLIDLKQAINLAIKNDSALSLSRQMELSLIAKSQAADFLPDAKLNLSMANIPTNTFNFDQEAMTQLKVGISQQFPRGDTLSITQEKFKQLSQVQPEVRKLRELELSASIFNLWLELYKANETKKLIYRKNVLFEQLADVAQASYSSASGKTKQQDIVRAQLEQTRLTDRLSILDQKVVSTKQLLDEYLIDDIHGKRVSLNSGYVLDLNDTRMILIETKDQSQQSLISNLQQHPSVAMFDKKIAASQSDIKLSKQKDKPAWGLSASYGYREDNNLGMERADLFSIGVTLDLPIFSGDRNRHSTKASVHKAESIKFARWKQLKNNLASVKSVLSEIEILKLRLNFYSDKLLPQSREQSEAALTAYTNDVGDFAEVVRSRISELNTEIEALNLSIEQQKKIILANYYLSNSSNQFISQIRLKGQD